MSFKGVQEKIRAAEIHLSKGHFFKPHFGKSRSFKETVRERTGFPQTFGKIRTGERALRKNAVFKDALAKIASVAPTDDETAVPEISLGKDTFQKYTV